MSLNGGASFFAGFSFFADKIIVNSQMFGGIGDELEIFRSVVAFIAVDMVNDLARAQFFAVRLLPDVAVIFYFPPVKIHRNILRFIAFSAIKQAEIFAFAFERANFFEPHFEPRRANLASFHFSFSLPFFFGVSKNFSMAMSICECLERRNFSASATSF